MTRSGGGTGLSTAQMHDSQPFLVAGWDFVQERGNGTAEMWSLSQDEGYPVLTVFSKDYEPHKLEGAGTRDDPYRIATAEDLAQFVITTTRRALGLSPTSI